MGITIWSNFWLNFREGYKEWGVMGFLGGWRKGCYLSKRYRKGKDGGVLRDAKCEGCKIGG